MALFITPLWMNYFLPAKDRRIPEWKGYTGFRTGSLNESLLASGFPYNAWTNDSDNGAEWHRFLKQVISLRSDGAAALDLCYVAAGRTDGYWELDLEAWDMAAGALIVQEAGGTVSKC